jgi:hypothetical protein
MKSYRVLWAGAWAVVLVPLCFLGLVLGEPAVVLILTGLAAALVVALLESRHQRRWWIEVAIAVGAFSATVYALGALAAAGVVFLVGATSPPAIRLLVDAFRRERGRRRSKCATARTARGEEVRAGAPLDSATFAGMVALLDDHELMAAWRHSHEVLGYTNLPQLRLELVALREAYLDELERRDPTGFAAWIEAGASRDPERFLAPRRTRELE